MPFKFKLSKRLALLKASLVASAVLALACDRSDLTSPQPPPSLRADAVPPLPVASVTASANDGNIPQNTLDNNLATRWAASGDGQWIRYDLGAVGGIGGVDIAWYLGDMRSAHFDIQVSVDTVTWTTVFSGQSSGQTLQVETYVFPTVSARYVRIVGHGQWNRTTLASWWIAITEAAIPGGTNVPVPSVTVSPASASIVVDATVQLSAVTKDSAGTTLTGQTQWWASGNTAVATVSASGLVTGVAAGSATITATSGGNSAGATVTVSNVPVASVVISPATATLLLGASLQLSATVKDSAGNVLSGRTVTWASGAPAVASVSASGLVSGLAAGTAPITATSGGASDAAAITATAPPSTSTAHQYYGAPTGSDASPCSATSPCYTMQPVSQLLSPGDTAHFAAGNYTW